MFDARLRRMIDPPLNAAGRWLAGRGVSANAVTLAGVPLAVGAAVAIAQHQMTMALLLIAANRLLDGLDGAVARARGLSDFGGYLDSLADFAFYVAVPLGFGWAAAANALPAAALIASFTLTGVSFLAFAAIAAWRGIADSAHRDKSFLYTTGLAEGGETIAVFVAMCLWPEAFPWIAAGYSLLCLATVGQRVAMARRMFGD